MLPRPLLRRLQQISRSFVALKHLHVATASIPKVPSSQSWHRSMMSTTQDYAQIDVVQRRPVINLIIRLIAEDPLCTNEAKSLGLIDKKWLEYLAGYRRKLVIDYHEVLAKHRDIEELFANTLKALSFIGKFSLTVDTSIMTDEDWVKVNHLKDHLFRIILKDAAKDLDELIIAAKILESASDLRIPHEWHPFARIIKRKIIYHGGPTNSGKTYHALQRLKSADSKLGGGLYCGPLRLLALEVYERLNKEGVITDLVTGQEQREIPFATHKSCTVEMVNLEKQYDVVVVDEIQMIADEQRGWAWTRVLQGIHANEIHLCGGLETFEIVKNLVELMGDDFVLHKYDRLSHLKISDQSLQGDYSKIQPGDCVVAFSRADIFSIRQQIEQLTPYKCAVIYGQLPPEIRSQQARLFNEGSGYDVLVASDAIGMGLNLNIRRIIFHTTQKPGANRTMVWMEPSQVKQIAGRAGRLSSQYKEGEVTTWQEVDLAYVKSVMSVDIPQASKVGIFPSVAQISKYSELYVNVHGEMKQKIDEDTENKDHIDSIIGADEETDEHQEQIDKQQIDVGQSELVERSVTTKESSLLTLTNEDSVDSAEISDKSEANTSGVSLSLLLEKFVESSKTDGRYFICNFDGISVISNWLNPIPLSLEDRFVFANAPINIRDASCMLVLYQFASQYALKRPVALNIRLPKNPPNGFFEFQDLCVKHSMLDVYLWLSCRFPKYFVEQELCLEQQAYCQNMIKDVLFSGRMQQQYSHSLNFKTARQFEAKDLEHVLPPETNSVLRDLTKTHLQTVDPSVWFSYPHLSTETSNFISKGHPPFVKGKPFQFSKKHTSDGSKYQRENGRDNYKDNNNTRDYSREYKRDNNGGYSKDYKDHKDHREQRYHKDHKDHKDHRNNRDNQGRDFRKTSGTTRQSNEDLGWKSNKSYSP